VTDAQGQFALKDLDRDLVFRLLAVADGYMPALSEKAADPKAGPVKFTLKPHELDKRDPALVLKGRVLNEAGRPVARAVVEPYGFGKGDGAQYGGLKGFDPLALTDDSGEFRIGVPERGLEVYIHVSAPLLSPRRFAKLTAGPKVHDLTLECGVTIVGRLVKDGKPLPGLALGVVQTDRSVTGFVGEFKAATDAKGVFTIPNVPGRDKVVVYGLMTSLLKHGAVTTRAVETGASGSVLDIGDLEVKPGHRLSGQVVLADGKPVPAGTRVMLARQEAWDHQDMAVDKDGRFTFAGLPPELYSLSANVRGYHVSPKNASQDVLNGFELLGMIRRDIADLRLLLEPGPEPDSPEFNQKLADEYERRRKAPLRGAPVTQ
jgi:hypothetical protein